VSLLKQFTFHSEFAKLVEVLIEKDWAYGKSNRLVHKLISLKVKK